MTIMEELVVEKQNTLNLLQEKDILKDQLACYKGMWARLKSILSDSIQSAWGLYRKTQDAMWLNYAESDKAVLEAMQEIEEGGNGK